MSADYRIIHGKREELEEKVKVLLNTGYELAGGIAVAGGGYYTQAVVKGKK